MKDIFIILTILILSVSSCRNEQPDKKVDKPLLVKVIETGEMSVVSPVQTTGIVSLSEEIKLSFKTGGIVREILAEEGERVKKGEVLASLNLSEINSAVELSGVAYNKAVRDWERARNLYADTVATLEQLQNAESAMKAAAANLEMARFNLKHSTIRAPDDGIILKLLSREGELVSAGYPVLLFGSEKGMWRIKAGLADRDLVKVGLGDSATARFDAWPDEIFSCIVTETGSLADPSTGTYEVELEFDNRGMRFASGFIGTLEIFPKSGTLMRMVPAGAVTKAGGNEGFVFSVSDSSTAVIHKIRITGIFKNEIGITGLSDSVGAIVYEGNAYLRDGLKVQIVK